MRERERERSAYDKQEEVGEKGKQERLLSIGKCNQPYTIQQIK